MTPTTSFDELFAGQRVLGVLHGRPPQRCVAMAERVWDAGIDSVEVPLRGEQAEESLRAVVAAAARRGLRVGAGTVVSPELARRAADLGAAYTVAPGLDAATAQASLDAGLPHLPGVATATEIQQAHALGLSWLKMFPATTLGPGWLKAMAGPFPSARFVATGGLTAANAADYLAAGAHVVGLGSALADPEQAGRLAATLARLGAKGAGPAAS